MMDAELNTSHGLVLQGGGALGAFELGAARVIYNRDCTFRPGVLAGVSIGAISAALLGRPARGLKPLEALETFWQRVTATSLVPPTLQPYASLVGLPNFFTINPFWMFGTSLYSVEPLRRTLSELVDVDRLADQAARPHLVFTATDVRRGQLATFSSLERPLTLDHVLASGSLPPSFPMTTIDNVAYWDGGLFDNTPLGALIDLLEGEDRAAAVVNLFPNKIETLPRSMTEVGQHCLNLLFANKTASDVKLMKRFDAVADLMAELEKLPADSPVRDLPSFKALAKADYKRVPTIVEITRSSPAEQLEASDFSHAGIERRADEGRSIARDALRAKGFL
ncbi:hypothetical protein RHAL1_02218 [Beijerinckiaceae bacterium RH AL1]|nr:patatin-like phospholipase family protein [Beijerinckiaceae bacterium]VVB46293.1 hypothetical protein RHCH11_RHCH11_02174 [Beijerinckiaceae bacterium RH CH11]VVB46378.1 hypothetical protein RHAL8_02170 [Beijerinckiaceae bacterium RH AL8]VVC55301.1 hypothetical protein RHAL1_02218 [Beijerinckiaceae bacterium RH AL1]